MLDFGFDGGFAPVFVEVLQGANELRSDAPHLSLGQLAWPTLQSAQRIYFYE
jgi:hypothetical protein